MDLPINCGHNTFKVRGRNICSRLVFTNNKVYYKICETSKGQGVNTPRPTTGRVESSFRYLTDEPPFCFLRRGVVFLFPRIVFQLNSIVAVPAAKVVKKTVTASSTRFFRKSIARSPPFLKNSRK